MMDDDFELVSESARTLAKEGASRGGKARAEKLSQDDRREIARRAAQARWGTIVLNATHTGSIRIGDYTIKCCVLQDETRVINQETFMASLGRSKRPPAGTGGLVSDIPPFLSAANLRPFIPPALIELSKPILYFTPGGGRSVGYNAEILPQVCEVYLSAREADVLVAVQKRAASAAEVLIRGLARVGIVALIDEATGFQEVRARDELERILEAYVQAEFRPWLRTFPNEFFREIYRLEGWEFKPGTSKRTPLVGKLVNYSIYEQLPQGVLAELRRLNPRTEKGYRAHKHFQFLTTDTGNVHLDRQISVVMTLMRIADDKHHFIELFEKAFPPAQPRLPLVLTLPDEADGETAGQAELNRDEIELDKA